MTAELDAHGSLMGGVRKSVTPQKLKLSKKAKAKLSRTSDSKSKTKTEPKGKTPSAKNVREALAEGKITPVEAADLNPRGGLRPKASDVREAYKSKNISAEEAYDLNPGASLNTERGSKSSEKDTGPINVPSERIYPTSDGLQPRTAISPGRQWNNG